MQTKQQFISFTAIALSVALLARVVVSDEVIPSLDEWASFAETLECELSEVFTVNDTSFLSENNRNYYRPFDDIVGVGVIYCGCEQDVVRALQFARHYQSEYEVPFSIRSGGHSNGAFSKCDGCIVIDLYRMKEQGYLVNFDKDNAVMLAVEPGVTLGELLRGLAASDRSDVSIPHGTCEGVGIGGFAQGGGLGYQQRTYGLTVDYVVGVRVVDCEGNIHQIIDAEYDSDLVRVNETTNLSLTSSSSADESDLLWAIRGAGGGSFGIVTKFFFKTFTIAPSQLLFKIVYPILSQQNISHFLDLYQWYFSDENEVPDFLTVYFRVGADLTFNTEIFPFGYKMNLDGVCFQDDIELCYDILYEILNYTEMAYVDSYSVINSSLSYYDLFLDGVFTDVPPQGARTMGYSRSHFIMDQADLSPSVVSLIASSYWAHITDDSKAAQNLVFYMSTMRGNIPNMDADFAKTSFEGRNAWSWVYVVAATIPTLGSEAIYATISHWEENVMSQLSDVVYVNGVDDGTSNITQLYPTASVYERLREIKSKYDQQNCFNWKW
eukprot:CAMPEP_0202707270 /NCGR_PEP_ID=MMETSP1385-20130828/19605_1 /ASSEMBLY_ACC=CAM_ASM_000861 /TAXON_ID=933848 /ORGANISM="Elphidium margaritaceum" /LENGTH=550 /DNA_ID=CAMNT_0049365949 /DNA_START=63 /DNA_END=1712 /DNA_ORIENTATION=+